MKHGVNPVMLEVIDGIGTHDDHLFGRVLVGDHHDDGDQFARCRNGMASAPSRPNSRLPFQAVRIRSNRSLAAPSWESERYAGPIRKNTFDQPFRINRATQVILYDCFVRHDTVACRPLRVAVLILACEYLRSVLPSSFRSSSSSSSTVRTN